MVDERDIRRIVDRPEMIPGVFNYCDRWCERCPLTGRCSVYAIEGEWPDDSDARDPRNRAFWDRVGEVFAATRGMILRTAEEMGVDLDDLAATTDAVRAEERARRERVDGHPLVQAAQEYVLAVHQWFEASKGLFDEKSADLVSAARMDLPGSDPEGEALDLTDLTDVVQWYHSLIYAKLRRALEPPDSDDPDLRDVFRRDADGSAKVALIGMDRSMAAWSRLLDHFPDEEPAILDHLVHLERLRTAAERAFPTARAFVRPGFDETP